MDKKYDKSAFILFGIQLVLNALWSILFFGIKSPLYAIYRNYFFMGCNITNNNIDNLKLCDSAGEHTKLYHPEVVERAKLANTGKRRSIENEFKKVTIPWNKTKRSYASSLDKVPKIRKVCIVCGTVYFVVKHKENRSKYCSKPCSYKAKTIEFLNR